jgi:DNA (cytosine-5)-methyltransferase 1
VAQRRRRVFVVASARADFDPAAVLFEFDGVRRDTAPGRQAGKESSSGAGNGAASRSWPAEVSSTLDTTFGTKQGLEDQHVNAGCPLFVPASTVQTLQCRRPGEGGMSGDDEHLIPVISPALNTCSGSHHAPDTKAYLVQPLDSQTFSCVGIGAYKNDNASATLLKSGQDLGNGCEALVAQPITFSSVQSNQGINADLNVSQTLEAKNPMAVAQPVCLGGQHPNAGIGIDQSPTLTNAMGAGGGHVPIVSMAVRRLTPVECERLQGFPDGYTNIPWRKKDESPDGPRYKALGNSWAVPVVQWIGKRIQEQINAA